MFFAPKRRCCLSYYENNSVLNASLARPISAFVLLGTTVSLGAYTFELYQAHAQLTETVSQYQVTLSSVVADNARLQTQYQMNVDALVYQLERKREQLNRLDARLEEVERSFDVGLPVSLPLASTQDRMAAAELDISARQALLLSIPNGSPLKYQRISSLYGKRYHPIYGKQKFHQGIDLVCRIGDPIIAPADGVIETVRPSKKGFGNFLTVRHGFGFMTSYAHLSRFKVRSGDFVRKGEVIATCGNSGNSTGPHLHYEVRFAGRLLNPKNLMDWSIRDFSLPFEKEKRVNWSELAALVEQNVEQMLRFSKPMARKEEVVSSGLSGQNKRG